MTITPRSNGNESSRTRSDRLYRISWFTIVAFLIGAMLSVTPLLWWMLPAALIDTLAPLGIVMLIVSAIILMLIEGCLWWETLW